MSQHSEDQKKQIYEGLSADQKSKQTYTEWVKEAYNDQYEKWMPWLEDKYLALFGKDNKASYVTKGVWLSYYPFCLSVPPFSNHTRALLTERADTLDKSKVTGIEQVDKIQDDVNNLVSGQVGKGGLFQPAGDMASKEGINRAERGGKDDKGTYGGPAANITDPIANNAKSVAGGAQSAGSAATEGAKSAGGYLGGMFGGGKKE
jgi:hypothetical protein